MRLAVLVVVLAAAAGCGADAAAGGRVLGPGGVTVTLHVNHSRFTPERVVVAEGTEVTFRVVNDDPIEHEFIVGPPDVHERHENGTEAEHGAVPGEVTLPAGATRETTYRFDRAGDVEFACHLPRHLDYGMRGVVDVRPA